MRFLAINRARVKVTPPPSSKFQNMSAHAEEWTEESRVPLSSPHSRAFYLFVRTFPSPLFLLVAFPAPHFSRRFNVRGVIASWVKLESSKNAPISCPVGVGPPRRHSADARSVVVVVGDPSKGLRRD